MEPHGLYNLTLGRRPEAKPAFRVGLLRERTGVPVFLLYLRGASAVKTYSLYSLQDVEREGLAAFHEEDRAAWGYVAPFFASEGSFAHVVTLPLASSSENLLTSMIGSDRGLNFRTGIYALKNVVETADLVVVPQAPTLLGPQSLRHFYTVLVETLAPLNHFFFILDLPKSTTPQSAREFCEGLILPAAALYYPWVQSQGTIAPAGALIAAAYQKNDREYNINELPANRELTGSYRPLVRLTPSELGECLRSRLNVIHEFGSGETRIWGGRTLADALDLDGRFISNQRTCMALREAIHEICEPFVLEPLHASLAKVVDVAVQSSLQPIISIFDRNARHPFSSEITIVNKSGEDVLEVNLTFSIPYAVDQMSLTLGLTG